MRLISLENARYLLVIHLPNQPVFKRYRIRPPLLDSPSLLLYSPMECRRKAVTHQIHQLRGGMPLPITQNLIQ
jgi:hypothetical protein